MDIHLDASVRDATSWTVILYKTPGRNAFVHWPPRSLSLSQSRSSLFPQSSPIMTPLYLSLAALSCLSFAGAEPFHMPLVRNGAPLSTQGYGDAADALRRKYRYNYPSTSKRQNTAAIPLVNWACPCFFLNLHLCLTMIHSTTTPATWVLSKLEPRAFNTPNQLTFSALRTQISDSPQSFNVILDTGSSDLWVTAPGCTTCTPGSTNFNSGASTSFQLGQDNSGQPVRVTITYGSGSVAGNLVRDTVAMGGFQVQNQPWILVDQTSTILLDSSKAGIMGLAFDTISNIGAIPFWQNLAQGGQLSTPEMSFWFTRLLNDQSAQEEDFGGIFTLGGQNQTLFTGDIEFLPLVTDAGQQTY